VFAQHDTLRQTSRRTITSGIPMSRKTQRNRAAPDGQALAVDGGFTTVLPLAKLTALKATLLRQMLVHAHLGQDYQVQHQRLDQQRGGNCHHPARLTRHRLALVGGSRPSP